MLQHVWQTMRLATTTFVTHSMTQLTHRSLQEIGERHVPVLDALRTRDPNLAEAAMRRHIEEPGDWIRDAITAADKALAAVVDQQEETPPTNDEPGAAVRTSTECLAQQAYRRVASTMPASITSAPSTLRIVTG